MSDRCRPNHRPERNTHAVPSLQQGESESAAWPVLVVLLRAGVREKYPSTSNQGYREDIAKIALVAAACTSTNFSFCLYWRTRSTFSSE